VNKIFIDSSVASDIISQAILMSQVKQLNFGFMSLMMEWAENGEKVILDMVVHDHSVGHAANSIFLKRFCQAVADGIIIQKLIVQEPLGRNSLLSIIVMELCRLNVHELVLHGVTWSDALEAKLAASISGSSALRKLVLSISNHFTGFLFLPMQGCTWFDELVVARGVLSGAASCRKVSAIVRL
jgi:hypothetical protein